MASYSYSVTEKSSAPPKKTTFCNIFTQAKCVSVKFCQFVASLHPHNLPILVNLP